MQIGLLGATGFVGAAIHRRLLAAGHVVRTVSRTRPEETAGWLRLDLAASGADLAESGADLAESGANLAGSGANLAEPGADRSEFAAEETQANRELARANRDLTAHLEGCEVLVDAATLTSYAAEPFDDLTAIKRVNLGIPLLLGRLLPASLGRIVYLSTIDVYAIPARLPITEESPTGPVTNYARTKRLAEHVYQDIAAQRRLPLVILRLSQVYGPADTSPKVIPAFVRSAVAQGRLPRLSGTGTETRDFVYVDDVAACVELALDGPEGCYNVATGVSRPVGDVPRILANLTGLPEGGCDGKPSGRTTGRTSGKTTGKPSYAFDIAKARRDLGFEPAVDLELGLERTLEWMRDQSSS